MKIATPNETSNYAADEHVIQLLLRKQAELKGLLEITQEINKNTSIDQLLKMVHFIMKEHLSIGKALFLSQNYNDEYELFFHYGFSLHDIAKPQILGKMLSIGFPNITYLRTHIDSRLSYFDYFIPVGRQNQSRIFVLIGEFNPSVQTMNNDLQYVETLTNLLSVALDNQKLIDELLQKERLQRDIELAEDLQKRLIPNKIQELKGIQFGYEYIPFNAVSGDYFDIIKCNDDEVVWCIADVSGKGIPAALLMANIQASLRAWVSTNITLGDLVKKLNEIVFDYSEGDRYLSLFIAKYNSSTRILEYVNAGHHPPIVLKKDNTTSLLKDGCTLIGIMDELPFLNIGKTTIEPGSFIFSYTDGLVERDNGTLITENKLAEILAQLKNLESLDDINDFILFRTNELFIDAETADDITLLTAKFD